MMRHTNRQLAALLALGALILGMTSAAVRAEDEIPFAVGKLFFQLNDTDEDLGIHALVDGVPWKRLKIEDPRERKMLVVKLRGRLRRQGLTEFKFESAEPNFEDFSAEAFFERFPEGEYEIEGITLDGEERENTVTITHVMPAPPGDFTVSGMAVPEDCDEGPVPAVGDPVIISWSAVTESHPDIGREGDVEIVKYEVDVEREAPELVLSFNLPGDATEVSVPAGLFESGDEIKFQVLAADAGGNETSSESCFEVL